MPRPSKCRRVCAAPRCTRFEPQNAASAQPVELQVDEFEALRLMDYEDLTQEELSLIHISWLPSVAVKKVVSRKSGRIASPVRVA